MPKAKLQHYIGELDASQIAQGMSLASRNARRLFEDASRLLKCERFPSAASLAALSIEESGKLNVLRFLAMAPSDNVRRQAWRSYRSHRSKNMMWIVPELFADGARTLEELRAATDPAAEHTAVLDNMKQLGFYTDCFADARWSDPVEAIDETIARTLVDTAGLLAQTKEITTKEVELWIAHMRPVYGAPLEQMRMALADWYEAMRLQGLSERTTESVRNFIWGSKPSDP